MGRYKRDKDYAFVVVSLRERFHNHNLEMQLVWLSELLLLHYYMYCRVHAEEYITHKSDCDIFIPRSVIALLQSLGKLSSVYKKLVNFRNTYVHEGSEAAYELFVDLYTKYQLELIELARIVDVNLNFNCVLYRILEKREL